MILIPLTRSTGNILILTGRILHPTPLKKKLSSKFRDYLPTILTKSYHLWSEPYISYPYISKKFIIAWVSSCFSIHIHKHIAFLLLIPLILRVIIVHHDSELTLLHIDVLSRTCILPFNINHSYIYLIINMNTQDLPFNWNPTGNQVCPAVLTCNIKHFFMHT
jgi:hypothetical protein